MSLRSDAAREVFAATGCPVELFAAGEGTAAREALRRFLHLTVLPWAEVVKAELSVKLDAPGLDLRFDRLMASDLAGRARAFSSMVSGGMPLDQAAALSGLVSMEG